jgi:hypothetical protein
VGLLIAASCGAPDGGRPSEAEAGPSTSVDFETGAWIATEYFRALAEGRPDDARDLLAPGPRSDASTDDLMRQAADLGGSEVAAVDAVEVRGDHIVLRVALRQPSGMRAADEPVEVTYRWVGLSHDRRGWRIASVHDRRPGSDELAPVVAWTRVHILEADLSLDVPHGWPQRAGEWAWSPPERDDVQVAIDAGPLAPDIDDRTLLPRDITVVRAVQLTLQNGVATEYSLAPRTESGEVPAGSRSAVHLIIRTTPQPRVIHLYGSAPTADHQESLRAVLRRMARSLELLEPSSLTTSPPTSPAGSD